VLQQISEAYQLLNAHDGGAFAALVRRNWAPDAEVVEPNGPNDREGALAGWLALLDAFEDLHFDTVFLTEQDDRVVVEHVVSGTHTGPLRTAVGEVPPTGRALRLPTVTVIEHDGALVRRWRSYYDQLSLLSQLGLLPASS
jgi:predicted ester cyclase